MPNVEIAPDVLMMILLKDGEYRILKYIKLPNEDFSYGYDNFCKVLDVDVEKIKETVKSL